MTKYLALRSALLVCSTHLSVCVCVCGSDQNPEGRVPSLLPFWEGAFRAPLFWGGGGGGGGGVMSLLLGFLSPCVVPDPDMLGGSSSLPHLLLAVPSLGFLLLPPLGLWFLPISSLFGARRRGTKKGGGLPSSSCCFRVPYQKKNLRSLPTTSLDTVLASQKLDCETCFFYKQERMF